MAVNYNIKELKDISELLTGKTGMPFSQLTHSFLKRRLNYVFDKFVIRKTDQFIEMLNQSDFIDELIDAFTVETTEMFRDPGLWRLLRQKLIDDSNNDIISVWIPNVSTGEELYSFLVLVNESGMADRVRIIANHASEKRIEKVRRGELNSKKMEVNLHNYKRFEGTSQLENYLELKDNGLSFNRDLLKHVEFRKSTHFSSLPLSKQTLVLFRNSMLTYVKNYHDDIISHIDSKVAPGGILCIGGRELLPEHFRIRFECLDSKEQIFRKYKTLND